MTTEDRVSKLEEVIPEIKTGIAEIKIILRERQTQETLINDNIKKDIAEINQKLDGVLKETPKIAEHEKRLSNIEDSQKWLWRTCRECDNSCNHRAYFCCNTTLALI